jgi:hypothetical protein
LAGPGAKADRFQVWKVVLGILAVANLAAFFLLVKPVGGSASDLEAQLGNLQLQIKRQQLSLRTSRDLVAKMEGARGEHDKFRQTYFMDRRTMSSTILSEIKGLGRVGGPGGQGTLVRLRTGGGHRGIWA